ncbi:MAG TPA: hypothetical protein PLT37_10035 [Kiritimatiellia bacterium]|jgi:hypothetical protein|nr:hypothetical protein [Kiritimatiellia bacterium]HQF21568.1 hypothetical protein [Kiritimatiellia bacterium]HQG75627.1 hypothetical protein [Kiritimatiellia bacterium]HXK79040.1 hypothetical protein [Kiritimatiellia bacterium]
MSLSFGANQPLIQRRAPSFVKKARAPHVAEVLIEQIVAASDIQCPNREGQWLGTNNQRPMFKRATLREHS